MTANILQISTGEIKKYNINNKEFLSAYKKDTDHLSVKIDKYGIIGDNQADKKHHGGEDKAILICANNHFDKFLELYKTPLPKLALSQNILIDNIDEKDVCVGDIYTLGETVLQVTQPRQPCWKIAPLFSKEISRFINKFYATGWYVKVLKGGVVDVDMKIIQKERLCDISIYDMTSYLQNQKPISEIYNQLMEFDFVAQSYKNSLAKIL